MKRKFFSALLVLLMICTPLMFFTGCQADPGDDVHFNVTGTGAVGVGASLSSMTGLTITLNYTVQKWNSDTDQYEYVTENTASDKGYDFAGTTLTYYYGATDKSVTISEALSLGMTVRGFDSSAAATGKKMTLSFGGKSVEVTYNVA